MKNRSIYSAMKQGILLCDEQARVIYLNDNFGRYFDIRLKKIKGCPITQVRPDSVVPQVIESGEAIEGRIHSENGHEFAVDVSPVIEEGMVVGSVTVVTLIDNVQPVKTKMNQLEHDRQMLSARMSRVNGTSVSFSDFVFISKAMASVIEAAKQAAQTEMPILLVGESGTGKNLFAQAIHNAGSRREGPFVAVNCATLGKVTLENELFGYEEGLSDPAASYGKAGLFEIAAGGTLFFDEISEMDIELQRKLLHVLQEGRLRRMGSKRDISMDVRIIAACNVDLEQYIGKKQFDPELYAVLTAQKIYIPALRERPEDIDILTEYFLKLNRIRHKRELRLDSEIRAIFRLYTWPDNVRELKNAVAVLSAFSSDGIATRDMLPQYVLSVAEENSGKVMTLNERVREMEREEIKKMLRRYGDRTEGKRKAAQALGISLATLYNKLG